MTFSRTTDRILLYARLQTRFPQPHRSRTTHHLRTSRAGIGNLPEEVRAEPKYLETIATVTALRASHLRVELLRGQLRTEITRRKDLLLDARGQVTRSAKRISAHVEAEPAEIALETTDAEFEFPN